MFTSSHTASATCDIKFWSSVIKFTIRREQELQLWLSNPHLIHSCRHLTELASAAISQHCFQNSQMQMLFVKQKSTSIAQKIVQIFKQHFGWRSILPSCQLKLLVKLLPSAYHLSRLILPSTVTCSPHPTARTCDGILFLFWPFKDNLSFTATRCLLAK